VSAPLSQWLCGVATTLVAALAIPGSAANPPDPLGHRLKLSFFQYAGTQQGESRISFGRFKGILRDKMTVLVEELPPLQQRYGYLNNLSLEPPGDEGLEDRLTTENAAYNYWYQSRSLMLFRGTIFSDSNGGYSAQSRLYLGDLRGDVPHPSIAVRLPIKSEDIPTTNDAHSLMVYYALAQDAMRMADDRSQVIALLSSAESKIRDLKAQQAFTPEFAAVEAAIERNLSDLQAVKAHH
jgi:hypothetical protein